MPVAGRFSKRMFDKSAGCAAGTRSRSCPDRRLREAGDQGGHHHRSQHRREDGHAQGAHVPEATTQSHCSPSLAAGAGFSRHAAARRSETPCISTQYTAAYVCIANASHTSTVPVAALTATSVLLRRSSRQMGSDNNANAQLFAMMDER